MYYFKEMSKLPELHDDVYLEIKGIYQQDGKAEEFNRWNGYVYVKKDISERHRYFSICGSTIDQWDVHFLKNNTNYRFLFSSPSKNAWKDNLNFTVLTNGLGIVDYSLRYDEDDDCFYGMWYFVEADDKEPKNRGFARITVEEADVELEYYKWLKNAHVMNSNLVRMEKMIKGNLANLTHHDTSEELFEEAKNYFRGLGIDNFFGKK